ncbi:right-handed parallel beta-helix repeat-containing protein [Paenibacillus sp. GCM10023248]|uniref:right-handed parallel beta-helix repeat-containing protein n=1 Tax=unclassified Paenibacillus TaxID=185978 RepID=UPI002377E48E|nr:right-handed parallel beta-helix repeat-containing protein [Paenibacillus sp. MAHUQ-63]MDD9270472.1 right-handed parallel beta-helix repeat-containing protein [Paenibacillus sp. MAHUQ-63]
MSEQPSNPNNEIAEVSAQDRAGVRFNRRKLLASIGAAGVAFATGGLLNGRFQSVASAQSSVTGNVYGSLNEKIKLNDLRNLDFCLPLTLSELSTSADQLPDAAYYVTDAGKEGFYLLDMADTTSVDNTGTVVVTTQGRRFKRVYGETIVLSWFGAVGDGTTVETQALQNALNAAAGKRLYIPKQRSGYYLSGQLIVPSDIVIEFEPGTVIQAIDTLKRVAPYERLIRIKNAKHVQIIGNGATLRMNKAAFSSGEQAHIFDISGSENVVIEGIQANDSGGDGFYIGNYEASQPYCKDIVLRHCTANNNRRQGLSVISVDGLLVENCRFTNTTGTAPKSGVDIEPNNNSGQDVLKKIRFVDCVAEGNVGRGFLVTLHRMTAANERVDITFEHCRTKGNSFGSSVNYGAEGANAVKGEVTFIDCVAEKEQYAGFSVLSSSPESIKVSFVRCRAVNCNTVNAPEDPYGYGSSFIVTTVPQFPRKAIGNVEFVECSSIEERPVPFIVRGFSIKKNSSEAIRDIRFVNCTAKGGAQRLLYVDPAADGVFADLHPQPELALASTAAIDPGANGHLVTNTGASGASAFSLPPSKKGQFITVAVESPYSVKLTPQSGSAFRTPAGLKGELKSANPGDSITLKGRSDGNWDITGYVGGWFETAAESMR